MLFDATVEVWHFYPSQPYLCWQQSSALETFSQILPTYEKDHFATTRQFALRCNDFHCAPSPHAIANIQSCPLSSASLQSHAALPVGTTSVFAAIRQRFWDSTDEMLTRRIQSGQLRLRTALSASANRSLGMTRAEIPLKVGQRLA